jgi:hypothetical protein
MKLRNVLVLSTALAVVANKVVAQTPSPSATPAPVQPSLGSQVINTVIAAPQQVTQGINNAIGQGANAVNLTLAQGIYDQMRMGNELVIKSELFEAIADVSLIFAFMALGFLTIEWLLRCVRVQFILPDIFMKLIQPILLIMLLANPTGQGFAMQSIVLGSGDLLNSFQTFILRQGGTAIQANGSAVKQANAKTLAEQTIRTIQIDCLSKLDETQRKSCFEEGYDQVTTQLNPYLTTQWGQGMAQYAEETLITNGANNTQLGQIGSAAAGVATGVGTSVLKTVSGTATAAFSPATYALLLLISSAIGIVIEVLKLYTSLFFPLSIAISLFPVAAGSWHLWFKGMFGTWISSLFLRLLVTVTAMITVAGSSITGELYTLTSVIIAIVCGLIAILSLISTLSGIARNVTTNIANFR